MDKRKGFSPKRIEEGARTAHVLDRARAATNAAIGQGTDRLGTPGLGKSIL
jgi:hypothetical protein